MGGKGNPNGGYGSENVNGNGCENVNGREANLNGGNGNCAAGNGRLLVDLRVLQEDPDMFSMLEFLQDHAHLIRIRVPPIVSSTTMNLMEVMHDPRVEQVSLR